MDRRRCWRWAVSALGSLAVVLGCDPQETDEGVSGSTGQAGAETGAAGETDDQEVPGAEDDCEGLAGACAGEGVCEATDCGGPTSTFNHFGCPRQACTADADCPSGEACFVLAYGASCLPSQIDCAEEDDACSCVVTDDCGGVTAAHCLPTVYYPKEAYCDVQAWSCDELGAWADALDSAAVFHQDQEHEQLAGELAECAAQARAAQEGC